MNTKHPLPMTPSDEELEAVAAWHTREAERCEAILSWSHESATTGMRQRAQQNHRFHTDAAKSIRSLLTALEAAKAENERLREALEPFAAQYGDDIPRPDDFKLFADLTLADFRRARSALGEGVGR